VKWTESRDGAQRTTLRVEHRLDRQNLADILCFRVLSYGHDLDSDPSLAFLESEIRAELADHGMSTWPYWRENAEAPQEADLVPWAQRQVSRLCPDWVIA